MPTKKYKQQKESRKTTNSWVVNNMEYLNAKQLGRNNHISRIACGWLLSSIRQSISSASNITQAHWRCYKLLLGRKAIKGNSLKSNLLDWIKHLMISQGPAVQLKWTFCDPRTSSKKVKLVVLPPLAITYPKGGSSSRITQAMRRASCICCSGLNPGCLPRLLNNTGFRPCARMDCNSILSADNYASLGRITNSTPFQPG